LRQATNHNWSVGVDPTFNLLYIKLCTVLLLFGHSRYPSVTEDCIDIYEETNDPSISRIIAISYYLRSTYNNDLNDATTAIRLNPNESDYYSHRGSTLYKDGRHEEAICDYTKAIELDPYDTASYCNRAASYVDSDNDESAITDYSRAIEIHPHVSKYYYLRGLQYNQMNLLEEATSDLTKSISLDPKAIKPYHTLVIVLFKLKQYEEVIPICTSIIEHEPDFDTYDCRATAYVNLSKYDEAFIDINKAFELCNEPDSYLYKTRGQVSAGLNRLEDALVDLTEAIDRDPFFCEAYKIRADVFHRMNRYKDAVYDYKSMIQLSDILYKKADHDWNKILEVVEKAESSVDIFLFNACRFIRQSFNDK
jgi:tetratricopeptide (TPR) repeat protein